MLAVVLANVVCIAYEGAIPVEVNRVRIRVRVWVKVRAFRIAVIVIGRVTVRIIGRFTVRVTGSYMRLYRGGAS